MPRRTELMSDTKKPNNQLTKWRLVVGAWAQGSCISSFQRSTNNRPSPSSPRLFFTCWKGGRAEIRMDRLAELCRKRKEVEAHRMTDLGLVHTNVAVFTNGAFSRGFGFHIYPFLWVTKTGALYLQKTPLYRLRVYRKPGCFCLVPLIWLHLLCTMFVCVTLSPEQQT